MRSFIFVTAAITQPNCNVGYSRIAALSSKRSITFGWRRYPFITLLSATIQEKELAKDDDDIRDDKDKNGADDDGDDDDFDVDSVSDAEALLACRSYLQRRNRLGEWTQFEKRKVQKRSNKQSLSSASSMSSSYGDKGFFWDDPSQLKYLYKNNYNLPAFSNSNTDSEPLVTMTGKDGVEDEGDDDTLALLQEDEELLDDDYDDDDSNDDDMWEVIRPQVSEHRSLSSTEHNKRSNRQTPTLLFWEDEDDDVLGETPQDFAAFDGTPSPEHVRRSRAAKLTWSDPEWRAQWHEKRWGTSRHSSMQNRNELRRRRKLEQRLRALDPDKFLPNQALAAMTETEIAHAIQEYVSSNKKRGRTRAKTKQTERQEATTFTSNMTATTSVISMKDMETTSTCKLTRQLEPDVMDLAKVQKKRSERAIKAYQTRLENQRVKAVAAPAANDDEVHRPRSSIKMMMTVKKSRISSAVIISSPLDALLQVERDLNEGFLPNVQHIQALLEPNRLARRKDVLLRILSECFGLRGKCIPATTALLPYDDDTASTLTLTRNDDDYPPGEEEEAISSRAKTSDIISDRRSDDDGVTLFLFATKVPVQQLGEFVIWKLLQTARVEVADNNSS